VLRQGDARLSFFRVRATVNPDPPGTHL
jgi:hypothetical protein